MWTKLTASSSAICWSSVAEELTLLGYWKEVGVVELLAVLVETGEVATSSFAGEARVLSMTESDTCSRSVRHGNGDHEQCPTFAWLAFSIGFATLAANWLGLRLVSIGFQAV